MNKEEFKNILEEGFLAKNIKARIDTVSENRCYYKGTVVLIAGTKVRQVTKLLSQLTEEHEAPFRCFICDNRLSIIVPKEDVSVSTDDLPPARGAELPVGIGPEGCVYAGAPLLVVGAANSGKTAFLRALSNTARTHREKVVFLSAADGEDANRTIHRLVDEAKARLDGVRAIDTIWLFCDELDLLPNIREVVANILFLIKIGGKAGIRLVISLKEDSALEPILRYNFTHIISFTHKGHILNNSRINGLRKGEAIIINQDLDYRFAMVAF